MYFPTEIIVATLTGIVTLIITIISVVTSKKYNIGPNQDKLVTTFKDLIAAQKIRIDDMQKTIEDNRDQIKVLQLEVNRLTILTIEQAIKIRELEKRGG